VWRATAAAAEAAGGSVAAREGAGRRWAAGRRGDAELRAACRRSRRRRRRRRRGGGGRGSAAARARRGARARGSERSARARPGKSAAAAVWRPHHIHIQPTARPYYGSTRVLEVLWGPIIMAIVQVRARTSTGTCIMYSYGRGISGYGGCRPHNHTTIRGAARGHSRQEDTSPCRIAHRTAAAEGTCISGSGTHVPVASGRPGSSPSFTWSPGDASCPTVLYSLRVYSCCK
jgi:hypothetical protein